MLLDLERQLTPNFKLKEFFTTNKKHGGQAGLVEDFNQLPEHEQEGILANLQELAFRLQFVKDKYLARKPILITSGWRSLRVNKLVGGAMPTKKSPGSYHLRGMAADFIVEGLTPHQVQVILDPHWPGGMELVAGWTHLDTRPTRARFRP